MTNSDVSIILQNELFNGVKRDLVEHLHAKESVEFHEGDIIFQSGDSVETLYLIAQGEVKLKIQGGLSSPVVVRKKANQFFGEKEILENTPRKSSCVAETNCILFVIKSNEVNRLSELSPEFKNNLTSGIKGNEGIRRRDILFSDKSEKISDVSFFKPDKIHFNDHNDSDDVVLPGTVQPEFIPETTVKEEPPKAPEENEVLLPPTDKSSDIEPDPFDYTQTFQYEEDPFKEDQLPIPGSEYPNKNDEIDNPFPPEPESPAEESSFSEEENISYNIPENTNNYNYDADDDIIINNINDTELSTEKFNFSESEEYPESFPIEQNDAAEDFSQAVPLTSDDIYLDILVAIEKIGSSILYHDLFTNISQAVSELMKTESTILYIVDSEEMVFVTQDNSVDYKEIKIPLEDSVPGICYSSKAITYNEYSLLVPVENKKDEITAVLELKNSIKGIFDTKDEQIIKAVSPFIADVIENSKLFKSDKFKGRLESLSSVSQLLTNDIKRPLLMIRHYVEYLKQKNLDEDAQKILGLINEQAGSILDLTQTVKEFADNSLKMNLVECEVTIVMDEYLTLLAEYTDSRKVKVLRKYEGQGTALLDRRKLYQAIYQIVKNACDAMPHGGNIYFVVRRNDPDIEIEIKDEGIGISEEVSGNIMKPFMSFGKKDASGLGLNIVQDILEKHKARLSFSSNFGDGSTFTISIPAADLF